MVGCGFFEMGTKTCTCAGGIYDNCSCPKPDSYLGAPTAQYCDSLTTDGMGMIASLNDTPCTTEWDECVGRDAVTGPTPKGCACLHNPEFNNDLMWKCQSTNQWFMPAL